MVKLVARKGCIYGGRSLAAGYRFNADLLDANALILVGWAAHADAAEPAPKEKPAAKPASPRRYGRRDMRAAD